MDARSGAILSFPATFDAYARAAAELRRMLEERGVNPRPRHHAELVFEEVVSNIIRHGCGDDPHCSVDVKVVLEAGSVVLDFQDNAKAFDPRTHEPAALPESLDEAAGGGLGLRLVRKAAERIDYERTRENRNRLTVTIAR
jgi:anti-sigma regulatory factor (Ser/Thr protein kinase)